jgi:hypothetical protein
MVVSQLSMPFGKIFLWAAIYALKPEFINEIAEECKAREV